MKYPRPAPCISCGGKVKRVVDSDGEFCSNDFVCETCGLKWYTNEDRMWYTKKYDGGESTTDGTRERVIRADIAEWNALDRTPLRECPICKDPDVKLVIDHHYGRFKIICWTCNMWFYAGGRCSPDEYRKIWNNRVEEPKKVCANCKFCIPRSNMHHECCVDGFLSSWPKVDPCKGGCEKWKGGDY